MSSRGPAVLDILPPLYGLSREKSYPQGRQQRGGNQQALGTVFHGAPSFSGIRSILTNRQGSPAGGVNASSTPRGHTAASLPPA